MMKSFLAALALVLAPGYAAADTHLNDEKKVVLACLELVGIEAEWTQCVALMFQPCAEHEVNSDAHTSCLVSERDSWRAALRTEQAGLAEVLEANASIELTNILNGWARFSDQKCQESSLARGGSAVALHGCEIAEVVSATSELVACRVGRSTAQFCVFKEPMN